MRKANASAFNPRPVPFANFELFGGKKCARAPAAALIPQIRDQGIRSCFTQISKQSVPQKQEGYRSLIEKLSDLNDIIELTNIIPAASASFESAFLEFDSGIRISALKMIDCIISGMKKDIANHAGSVFPPLFLFSCDSDTQVSEFARGLVQKYFPTPEKRNLIMSKLRREMCLLIRATFSDLLDMETKLTDTDSFENWGRISAASFILSSNLLLSCKFSEDVYSSIHNPPLKGLLKLSSGQFQAQASVSMRSSVYFYATLCLQNKLISYDACFNVLECLKSEASPKCQERLVKLVILCLEMSFLKVSDVSNAIISSLGLFYQPEPIGLDQLMAKIASTQFLDQCVREIVRLTDFSTCEALMKVVFSISQKNPDISISKPLLLNLLQQSLSTDSANRFLMKCPLDYYVSLKDDFSLDSILENGNENRVYDYLMLVNPEKIFSWLKTRKSISPKIIENIIKSQGTVGLRKIYPSFFDIPFSSSSPDEISNIVMLYARTEEIPYIIERTPEILEDVLPKWTSDFSCFKSEYVLNQTKRLLTIDLMNYRFLNYIFPNEPIIDQETEIIVLELLSSGKQIDPSLFEYYKPSLTIQTKFLLSNSIEVLDENDVIIPMLVRLIPKIVNTENQSKLADAAFKLLHYAQLEPTTIAVSPIDAPVFCLEFWTQVGFDNMNPTDFCFLLEEVLIKRCPWLPCYIYIRSIDWKFVPWKLWEFTTKNPNLLQIAAENNLSYALACICSANNITFDSQHIKSVNGLIANALSTIELPRSFNSDLLSSTIHFEWNHAIPEKPSLESSVSPSILLRLVISYLTRNVALLYGVSDIIDYIKKVVHECDRFVFFLCLRVLSIIRDTDYPFDSLEICKIIIHRSVEFYPLPAPVEKEFASAIRVAHFITPSEFPQFIIGCSDYFGTSSATFLEKQLVPLLVYFNTWNLVETRLDGRLDLSNVNYWYFVVNSLLAMPYAKRIDLLPSFADELVPLLDTLSIESEEFVLLIRTFPSTALKWSTSLSNTKLNPLISEMQKKGTAKIFAKISKQCERMKIPQTTITSNNRSFSIVAIYQEDDATNPVQIDIRLMPPYPFKNAKITCDLAEPGLSKTCEHKVAAAIASSQSIDSGIKAWHDFVVREMHDKDPCTICYSYLDEGQKMPKVKCATCNQKFHGSCLSKWFSHCLQPTCPYCSSPWKPK